MEIVQKNNMRNTHIHKSSGLISAIALLASGIHNQVASLAACIASGPSATCITAGQCFQNCQCFYVNCNYPGGNNVQVCLGAFTTITVTVPTIKADECGQMDSETVFKQGTYEAEVRYDWMCGVGSIIYFTESATATYSCSGARPKGPLCGPCQTASTQEDSRKVISLAAK